MTIARSAQSATWRPMTSARRLEAPTAAGDCELLRELAFDEVDEKPQQQHGHERDAADDFQPARRLDDEVAGDLLIRGYGRAGRFAPSTQNEASVVRDRHGCGVWS